MTAYSPCPLPPGSSVWVYFRDSGGETQDLYSQREKVLEYCQDNRLVIARTFEDAARSGSSTTGRDEFAAMIDLAQAHKKPIVAGLVCWDMARFSRSLTDAPFYRGLLERIGYKLIFVANFIPDGLTGAIVKAAYDTAGALLLEQISYNSRRGLQQLFDLAFSTGLPFWPGRVPRCFLGKQWPTGRILNDGTEHTAQILVPDPATWEAGQLAFQMRAERRTYHEIVAATGLFDEIRYGRANGGVADPLKGKGAESRVTAFFRQTIYKGVLTRKGIEYPNYVQAMVSPELWQAANSFRYHRGEPFISVPHPKAGRTEYLLSGLARCGRCGGKIYGVHAVEHKNGKQYHRWYYECTTGTYNQDRCKAFHITIKRVDPAIMSHLLNSVLTVEFFEQLLANVQNQWQRNDGLEQAIEDQAAEVRDLYVRIRNLREQVEGGDSAAWEWYRERERQLREAEGRLEQLQRARVPEPPKISSEALQAAVEKLRKMAGSELIRERQLAVQAVVDKVELHRDKAVLHYKSVDNLGGVCYNIPWEIQTISHEIFYT